MDDQLKAIVAALLKILTSEALNDLAALVEAERGLWERRR
jgi:hypothetical protein